MPSGMTSAIAATQKNAVSGGSKAPVAENKAASGSGGSASSVAAYSQLAEKEAEYLSPVSVGGQEVYLLLDTGSSDL